MSEAGLRAAFERPTLEVARLLLGTRLVREPGSDERAGAGRRVGRIVEVEAYLGPADLASHARHGPTPRNLAMYGEAGRAYVYLVYGIYHCLNVVTGPPGEPHAILIRAVEPLEGIAAFRAARMDAERRSRRSPSPADLERSAARVAATPAARLAAGPGLVGAAFGLDRRLTGVDLLDPDETVHIEPRPSGEAAPVIAESPRIGIAYAGAPWVEKPWRFAIAANPSVSR